MNALLGGVIGAVTSIADALFNAIDFATGILNFFKCDDDKACPTQNEISRSGDSSETTSNTADEVTWESSFGYKYGKGGTGSGAATLNYNVAT